MKQIKRLLMGLSLIFLLVACGGDSEPVAQLSIEEPVVQQETPT